MKSELELAADAAANVAVLAGRYLWWEAPAGSHSLVRAVAQIMNLGTYEDIRKLEEIVPPAMLRRVMFGAQPGWFSARSWEFWRGRLGANLPDQPPSRSLADVS